MGPRHQGYWVRKRLNDSVLSPHKRPRHASYGEVLSRIKLNRIALYHNMLTDLSESPQTHSSQAEYASSIPGIRPTIYVGPFRDSQLLLTGITGAASVMRLVIVVYLYRRLDNPPCRAN